MKKPALFEILSVIIILTLFCSAFNSSEKTIHKKDRVHYEIYPDTSPVKENKQDSLTLRFELLEKDIFNDDLYLTVDIKTLARTFSDERKNTPIIPYFNNDAVTINKHKSGFFLNVRLKNLTPDGLIAISISVTEDFTVESTGYGVKTDNHLPVLKAEKMTKSGATATFEWYGRIIYNAEKGYCFERSLSPEQDSVAFLNRSDLGGEIGESEFFWSNPRVVSPKQSSNLFTD